MTDYQLELRGEISDRFAAVFEGMRIEQRDGNTLLTGPLADQAQLFGVLDRIQSLGLELVSIKRARPKGPQS